VTTPEERAWEVVRRAFEEREPSPPRRARGRLAAGAAVLALGAVAIGAFLSSPGHAVFERVRQAVGVERAAPALVSLPAPGRLLVVTGGGGVWVVDSDGLRRELGRFDDASWSPHGLYVVATTHTALTALDPRGRVRWTLARRDPHAAAWEGTLRDTRIAYLAADGLRVVAGDGTYDHLLDRGGRRVPPVWDPARLHTVTYAVGDTIVLRRDTGGLVWRRPLTTPPASLAWSSDGRYLAVVSVGRVVVLDASGRVRRTIAEPGVVDGTFAPGSHRLALDVRLPHRGEVRVVDVGLAGSGRLVFAGPGGFGGLAWSPDGRWLLVSWPAADQWVFLRGTRARAVANIGAQFAAPAARLEVTGRWCCDAR
jgi:hypothetical protein